MQTKITSTKKISNLFSVLYSESQNCFHIERLSDTIVHNLKYIFVEERKSDYRLVGVFNNYIEADEYIKQLRKQIEEIKYKH